MSHVICSPQISWVATGKSILAMGWNWDGHVTWRGNGNAFLLRLRGYAWGGERTVFIDPTNGVFRMGGENGPPEPLAEFHRRFNEETTPPVKPLAQFANIFTWVVVILMLAGAILWIKDIVQGKPLWRHTRKQPATPVIREGPLPTPTMTDESKRLRELKERLERKP